MDGMKVVFLGTGAGMPSKLRNVSSMVLDLTAECKAYWMFDCGEATQHQILHTHLRPRKIEKIFISHLHGDHIFGLPGLLGSRSNQEGQTKVTVYGPKGIQEFLNTALSVSQTFLKYPLEIITVQEGLVFEDEQFVVHAKKMQHGVPCYAYSIEEKDQPGALLVDKLREIGVKPGPIYREIKNGGHVMLEDGRIIQGADFIGPNKKGRKITFITDTHVLKESIVFAKNSDLLIHEGTFAQAEAEQAKQYYHSTVPAVAQFAKAAKVKQLVLTHISSRYQRSEWQQLLKEATEIFQQTALAEDFYEIEV